MNITTLKNEEPLPEGWILCESKSTPGRLYYFNKKTGKSSWNRPQIEENKDKQLNKRESDEQKKKDDIKNLKRKKQYCHEETPLKRSRNENSTSSSFICNENCSKSSANDADINSNRCTQKASEYKDIYTKAIPQTVTSKSKSPANDRLYALRAHLSEDAKKETTNKDTLLNHASTSKSPVKTVSRTDYKTRKSECCRRESFKISPKTNSTEQKNIPKNFTSELKSPNTNDSKCSTGTNVSPCSDSIMYSSIPSPSQFLTANKILSSIKAQLPEDFNGNLRRNIFELIEEGIANQTSDQMYLKYPSTPPQFSEATKLVTAIKSKLSRERHDCRVNSSANERLQSLRASLSNEANAESNEISKPNVRMENDIPDANPQVPNEPNLSAELMDVDVRESKINHCKDNLEKTNNHHKDLVLVVDTNVFIHEIELIKTVLNSQIKGYTEPPTLIIPWRVINELDRMKDNKNGNSTLSLRAKAAMDYLYKSLPENGRIKGQSLRDANSHMYPCEIPDDEILNCCLQQAERGKSVILLSNDRNLGNKATINSIKNITIHDLKNLLEATTRRATAADIYGNLKYYENSIYQLLANILENEMRAKYKTLWQHVLFKAPPWNLIDVLQCILKHWVAVFNEVFPRIEHLLRDLKTALAGLEKRDIKNISLNDVENFGELALEIARKCQIIPEYMELAKLTVQKFSKNDNQREANTSTDQVEMVVIEAFENIWTVFSSYCAKLASALGIQNSLEDMLPTSESLESLTRKWPIYSNQIYTFTHCLKGALSVPSDCDLDFEEQVTRLEQIFKESLKLINLDCNSVNVDSLKMFCVNYRSMIQEAHIKFSQLAGLLDLCKNSLASKHK